MEVLLVWIYFKFSDSIAYLHQENARFHDEKIVFIMAVSQKPLCQKVWSDNKEGFYLINSKKFLLNIFSKPQINEISGPYGKIRTAQGTNHYAPFQHGLLRPCNNEHSNMPDKYMISLYWRNKIYSTEYCLVISNERSLNFC